jgi:hypothetical protein
MEKIGKSDGKRLPVFSPDCDAALEYAPARIDEYLFMSSRSHAVFFGLSRCQTALVIF